MSRNRQIILVFGLPGAGKTTLINNALDVTKNAVRLSGGSLIQEELSEHDRDGLRKLNRGEVLSNQEVLIFNFQKKKSELPHQHILFDGHCVIKNGAQLVEVPFDVIKRLEPDQIVFIDEKTDVIIKRRELDTARPDREKEGKRELDQNRDFQISLLEKYAKDLSVPLHILRSPTMEEFLSKMALCC